MPRDAYASLRLPVDLKAQVQEIADSQKRSLSNTIELLLWRGVEVFKSDGVLLGSNPNLAQGGSASHSDRDADTEQFSQELVRQISSFILSRIEKEGPPRSKSRDGPTKRRSRRSA